MNKNGWKEKTIGDLCDFTNGYGFSPPDWSNKGLPIIRIQNLNGSQDFNYYEGEPEEKWIVKPGDLLFAWAGTKGVSFGPAIWKGKKGVLNQHIYRIHPRAGVSKEWLYYALQVATVRIETKAHGFKSTLLHVRKDDITAQVVIVPNEIEQHKIADLLHLWDRGIENLEHFITAKTKLKRGLMQQLLTGRRRFSQFNGRAWDNVRFGEIFTDTDSANLNNSISNVITVGKYAIRPQLEHFNRSVASKNLSNYKVIMKGDFVYDPMSAYYGAFGRYDLEEPGIVSPVYRVVRLKESICSDFIKHLIKSHKITHALDEQSTQGNKPGKRRGLQREAFASISFQMPDVEEQEKIASVLNASDREIDLLQKQLVARKKQKQGLMQKLLTGQIRVKV